ncbi:unnamed protein product [Paramecium octaurelia]|uniref:Uncharacterized protein n=1 Tax=Paramecium octaurelia TaxID=43137 RepID=A0A8S1VQ87_PAROT|nr:unnamed protein product [Paramecium octaurelia]
MSVQKDFQIKICFQLTSPFLTAINVSMLQNPKINQGKNIINQETHLSLINDWGCYPQLQKMGLIEKSKLGDCKSSGIEINLTDYFKRMVVMYMVFINFKSKR